MGRNAWVRCQKRTANLFQADTKTAAAQIYTTCNYIEQKSILEHTTHGNLKQDELEQVETTSGLTPGTFCSIKKMNRS